MLCFDTGTSIYLDDKSAFWELMSSIAFMLKWKNSDEKTTTLLIAMRTLRSIQKRIEGFANV